jgi:hypothetical protein
LIAQPEIIAAYFSKINVPHTNDRASWFALFSGGQDDNQQTFVHGLFFYIKCYFITWGDYEILDDLISRFVYNIYIL